MPQAVVVGGGLGGLAAGIALRQAGYDVLVYEQATAERREGGSITLWSNGMAALAALGVTVTHSQRIARMVMRDGRGRELLDLDVRRLSAAFGYDCTNIWRHELIADLTCALDAVVHYGKRCIDVVSAPGSATARFADGTVAEADVVVAADGVHSRARSVGWRGHEAYAGTTCWEGQVDGAWPALPAASILAVATRSTYAMAFPMPDERVHWFIDHRQPERDTTTPDTRTLQRISRGWPEPFPDLVAATPATSLYQIPIFVRRPPRRWYSGRTALLGDAAHAMGPALGQGGAQAFIDAIALRVALLRSDGIDNALAAYQRQRAAAIWRLWIGSNLTLRMRRTGVLELATRLTPSTIAHRSFARSITPDPLVQRPV